MNLKEFVERTVSEYLNEEATLNKMILYHVTPNKFKKFDNSKIGFETDKGWFGKGFYFFTNEKDAIDFSRRRDNYKIMKVDVRLNKPLIINKSDLNNEIILAFKNNNIDVNTIWDIQQFCLENNKHPEIVTNIISSLSYDGIVLNLFSIPEVLVFDSDNIIILNNDI